MQMGYCTIIRDEHRNLPLLHTIRLGQPTCLLNWGTLGSMSWEEVCEIRLATTRILLTRQCLDPGDEL